MSNIGYSTLIFAAVMSGPTGFRFSEMRMVHRADWRSVIRYLILRAVRATAGHDRGSAEKAPGDSFHKQRQRFDEPTAEEGAVRQRKNNAGHRCCDNCLHRFSVTAIA